MKSLKYYILVFMLYLIFFGQYKVVAQNKIYDACIGLTFQVDSLLKISKIQTETGNRIVSNFLLCFDDKKDLNNAELRQYSN